MGISTFLTTSLQDLSEENYNHTFSVYRFWIGVGAAHGGIPNDQLEADILNKMQPGSMNISPRGQIRTDVLQGPNCIRRRPLSSAHGLHLPNAPSAELISNQIPLLLRFITDAELDPVLSTYAIGLHDRLCRRSLEQFFSQNLDFIPNGVVVIPDKLCKYYTTVNLVAHWVNLGRVGLEDVRDRILQSLTFQPTVHAHQSNSLAILLRISGAAFAAYVDPLVVDHCCDVLRSNNLEGPAVATRLAEVSALTLAMKKDYEF